eukprot:COSAG02_NODE_57784_length_279_cov_0.877778_1_plen_31_part_10
MLLAPETPLLASTLLLLKNLVADVDPADADR